MIPMFDFMAVIAIAYGLSPLVEGYRLGWHKPPRPYLETERDFLDPRHVCRPDPEDEDKPSPDAYRIDPKTEASLIPYLEAYRCALAGTKDKPRSPRPSDTAQTLQIIPRWDGNGGEP